MRDLCHGVTKNNNYIQFFLCLNQSDKIIYLFNLDDRIFFHVIDIQKYPSHIFLYFFFQPTTRSSSFTTNAIQKESRSTINSTCQRASSRRDGRFLLRMDSRATKTQRGLQAWWQTTSMPIRMST